MLQTLRCVNAGVKARIYAAELFGVEGDQMATT